MDKKLHGAAAHSHQYYTVEGGKYDDNRRAEGVMLALAAIHLASFAGNLAAVIHNAVKKRRNVN